MGIVVPKVYRIVDNANDTKVVSRRSRRRVRTDTITQEGLRMKSRLFSAFAAAIVTALALPQAGAQTPVTGVTSDTIVIGQLGPLTGPNFTFGALVMDGSDMVFNQVNERGGIHGRRIRTVREDDQCSPQQALSAVKKLVADHRVFAINGGGCSNAALAQRPYIEETGVPFMVFSATNDRITVPVVRPIFRVVMRASEEGAIQARFVDSMPGSKRVAIVSQRDAWGVAKYEGFMNEAKRLGLQIVADEEMTVDTPDATAQALKLTQARPDVIVTLLFPKPTVTFLRSAHQYGLTKMPVIGHSSVSDLLDLEQKIGLRGALDNFYTISLTRFAPTDPAAAELRTKFRGYFPSTELTQYAMWGIASAEVIVEALRRAGPNLTREAYLSALEGLRDFETSVFPGRISFSATDHDGNKSGLFVRLVNGKPTPIGTRFQR